MGNFSAAFTVALGNTVVVSFMLVPSGTQNGIKKEERKSAFGKMRNSKRKM